MCKLLKKRWRVHSIQVKHWMWLKEYMTIEANDFLNRKMLFVQNQTITTINDGDHTMCSSAIRIFIDECVSPNLNQWKLETSIADMNRLLVVANIMERNSFLLLANSVRLNFFFSWKLLLPFISLAMVNAVKIDIHKNVRISNAGGVTTPQSIFTFSVTIQLTMEIYFSFTKCFFVFRLVLYFLNFCNRIQTQTYIHLLCWCFESLSSLVRLAFDALLCEIH